MVTKRQNLAPVRSGENCSGYGNGKKFITVHQTGNTNKGANAQMHANLQMRVWGASWHWQVDDKEAIQSFPHSVKCWHASDGERGDGNANSIGVEGCINSDGDYKKSVQNMAELVAWIAKEESIPVANIKQHHDFARDNKNCPAQIRGGKDGIDWAKFVQMVQGFMNEKPVVAGAKVERPKTDKQLADEVIKGLHGTGAERKAKLGSRYNAVQKLVDEMLKPKPVAKPKPIVVAPKKTATDSYKETGAFYPNDTIIVRNAPSTNATIVARYYKGEHVKYHTVHLKNGYVWLQYTRGNGQQAYIPCRTYSNGKYGALWGTIK